MRSSTSHRRPSGQTAGRCLWFDRLDGTLAVVQDLRWGMVGWWVGYRAMWGPMVVVESSVSAQVQVLIHFTGANNEVRT